MADDEDKTLAPTDKRLERAREQGQAPLSRELVTAAGLGSVTLLLVVAGPGLASDTALRLRGMLSMTAEPGAAVREAVWAFLIATLPLLVLVGAASAVAVLMQTRLLLHWAALVPDLSRLDPARGLKKIVGIGAFGELGKSIVKLTVVSWALWRTLDALWPSLAQASIWTEKTLIDRITQELTWLVVLVFGIQCAIGLLDIAWTRFRYGQKMRMSREEVKQEQRESDGDPLLKARLRQLRHARTRKRMIAAVGKATVVITNPTHYAVALYYERGGNAAPKVVAKGMDEVAARIRQAAERAGVPLVANPPLARALHTLPLDAEVPPEHFKVVAEVIAYVWKLRGLAK